MDTPFPQETFWRYLRDTAQRINDRIGAFKELAKAFYFEVLYSIYKCPQCTGKLVSSGPGQAACSCGVQLDPTITFQKSSCCGSELKRKVLHYECRCCGKSVRSQFLFDERLFDQDYFKSKMQESRERKRKKRKELKRLLAGTRSKPLALHSELSEESLSGFNRVLNEFIGSVPGVELIFQTGDDPFIMDNYRNGMLELLDSGAVWFSAFHPLNQNVRKDRSRRFITLIFMEHEREVDLLQQGDDILVRQHEAYAEG